MITAARLRTQTVKQLAAMARREGVAGWHSMRKEQLIKALLKCAKKEASRQRNASRRKAAKKSRLDSSDQTRGSNGRFEPKHAVDRVQAESRISQIRAKLALAKDLARRTAESNGHGEAEDRLVVMVRDPYWLHAYWELSRQSVDRAQVVLGQHWHGAKPVLRLMEVAEETAAAPARTNLRDIEIHGGVSNWYIDVPEPPRRFQVEIGYLANNGRFLALARSNVVTTSPLKKRNGVDGNWLGVAEDHQRIFAMSTGIQDEDTRSELKEVFEKKLRRPMNAPFIPNLGSSPDENDADSLGFPLAVDAEMVVYGVTNPDARLSIKGQRIPVRDDGTFTMRFAMPNRRQVLPLVADSGDGTEQRMVVIAVERNTKSLEPVAREIDE